MIDERQKAFDSISKVLAITRYDIEHHQAIGDYSLNIHGENYFRDVFNFIYDFKLKNANFATANAPCIDLVDNESKLAYQITTTRTKEKIENTLKALLKPEYKGYTIKIYFLLDKAKPSSATIQEIEDKYNVLLSAILIDYNDLIKDIEDLETNKLIALDNNYFKGKERHYSNEIVLDFVCQHLLKQFPTLKKSYDDDDYGSVDTDEKLKINNINRRLTADINKGLDNFDLIENLKDEGTRLSDLRYLIVDDIYRKILIETLKTKVSKAKFDNKTASQLHELAQNSACDFNHIIAKLHDKIESYLEIKDFNAMNITWVIVAYLFEICDVGVHES